MYSEKVFDHFHHPRNLGAMADATAVIEVTNPVCGDLLKMWVLVRDGGVSDVKFKVEGCIPAVACASWLTETMMGKPWQNSAASRRSKSNSGWVAYPLPRVTLVLWQLPA